MGLAECLSPINRLIGVEAPLRAGNGMSASGAPDAGALVLGC